MRRIPEPLVKKYQQIRERRNGIAVAVVVDGACQGCNVQLRPQMVVELHKYSVVSYCPNCHRILVPEELIKDAQEKRGDG